MCACAIPIIALYGPVMSANRPCGNTLSTSSASTVLSPTVARTTRWPRARSSGTSVATTFSMPP